MYSLSTTTKLKWLTFGIRFLYFAGSVSWSYTRQSAGRRIQITDLKVYTTNWYYYTARVERG